MKTFHGSRESKAGSKRRPKEQSRQPQRDKVNHQVSAQHAPAKRQLPPANEIRAGNHFPPKVWPQQIEQTSLQENACCAIPHLSNKTLLMYWTSKETTSCCGKWFGRYRRPYTASCMAHWTPSMHHTFYLKCRSQV